MTNGRLEPSNGEETTNNLERNGSVEVNTSLERASFGKNDYSAQNLFLTLTLHLSYTFFHNVTILSMLMPYNTAQL